MFIYHRKPTHMQGHKLYPLSQLKTHYPELYAQEISKYDDHPRRKALPERIIPKLNCRGADVLHCAPIHPRLIYQAWRALGAQPKRGTAWFRIPIGKVRDLPVVIRQGNDKNVPDSVLAEDMVMWLPDDYQELSEIPQITLEWYAQLHARGKIGAHFKGIAHVLVQGALDTRELEQFFWDEA